MFQISHKLKHGWKRHGRKISLLLCLIIVFQKRFLKISIVQKKSFQKYFYTSLYLSLVIACLGLYGLISYATTQKIKEIGIRKVLGASVNGIATMLSGGFLKLVLLACVIAMPVAWFIMNRWLEDFAYRTYISWWMFAVAGSLVLLVALITVSFEAIKAADC